MYSLTKQIAVAVMGLGLLAMTAVSAEAGKKYRHNNGANFAAGLATGLIIGGVVGSQRRSGSYICVNGYCNGRYYGPRRYYPSRYYYKPAPRYYRPPVRRYYRTVPRHRASLPQAHYNYCFAKYRSYRVYDNTFQPYHGPRKQCLSPYY